MQADAGPRALIIEHLDRRWLVEPGPKTVVGRSAQCDITIDNDLVSRLHLELSWVDGAWQARDLQSANGTHVNGNPTTNFMIDTHATVVLGGTQGAVLTMRVDAGDDETVAALPLDDQPTVEGPPPRPNFAPEAATAAIPIVQPGAEPPPVLAPTPAAMPAPLHDAAPPPAPAPAPAASVPSAAPASHGYADDPPPQSVDRVDGIAPPPGESLSGPVGSVAPSPSALAAAPPPAALPAADWYPDPDDPARLRYWDGYQWTEHWHPPRS